VIGLVNPIKMIQRPKTKSQPLSKMKVIEEFPIPKEISMREINDFFKIVNRFISMTFRYKDSLTPSHLKEAKAIGAMLNIKLNINESS
jgi:hypothetical protein